MTTLSSSAASRAKRLANLFPAGVPTLWCPLLTHYDSNGAIDRVRMAAHLRHLAPHVKGFLIPGSTGDGWELDETETRALLDLALDEVARLNLHLLIGVLKTDAAEMRHTVLDTLSRLKTRTGATENETALRQAHVCGFTICPPRGKELSQTEIETALVGVLELGLPTTLYQLPQITQNEISPELSLSLARRFANFLFFKDTSGADRVANVNRDLDGVFLVRGAEGDYARWLRAGGGPYHGFLLSTANCFGRELHQIESDLSAGRAAAANELSLRLTTVVNEAFRIVAGHPHGNAFANANKAMDHFFAHGPAAAKIAPPRLHAGSRLPEPFIRAIGELLSAHGFMPAKGYLREPI
ncbi:MAG: dihydrodipicolinate synthase family protein [Verrucomicrobia bacterium]|nr:dihydrodipicolinate synthase family protein [Verrucomicrobiota bacterium]